MIPGTHPGARAAGRSTVAARGGRSARLGGLFAALLAVAPATGGALAEAGAPESALRVGIANLALFAPPSAEPAPVVPAGTRSIEVRFDYVEVSGHEIAVTMKGRGGIDLFGQALDLAGDGSARVAIAGGRVFPRLVEIVDVAARDAKRNAKQAATQAVGTQEFLLSVQAGILRVGYALGTLEAIDPLPPAVEADVSAAAEQVERALRRAERAIALPADDVAGKQRDADAIDAMLGPVVEAAGELTAAAAGMPELPLPATGAGPQDAFVVQVLVDGDVAATAELWVTSPPRIYLPYGAAR